MAIRLKQSTASQEFPLGPFLDSTDGVTPETALSIANTDIKLWKMGTTSLANKNSGGATHISGGIYHATLDATDTDTPGAMIAFVSVSGALPIKVEFEVVSANVYDALIGGTDLLQVDVTDWKNATAPAMTGDAFARLGAPAGASVSADVASIKTDTGTTIPAALAVIDDFLDTEVAAIKAKTDNLPASPAAVSDIPTALQNADALLNRDMSAVSDTNARSPLNALRFLRNKWSISGTTLTVTKENDSTSAWTATVTAAPGADPISGNDPT